MTMEGEQPIRWGCVALLLSLVAAVAGAFAWFNHRLLLTASGMEYPPQEQESWLMQQLDSDFRWSKLPHGSVERVWIKGFQDHVFLFRIRLSPAQFADLRQAILSSTAEGAQLDDADDLALCPFDFGTSKPQGPEKMKVPHWWEVASLRSLDGLLWSSAGKGYWFGYDRKRGILFLLNYSG